MTETRQQALKLFADLHVECPQNVPGAQSLLAPRFSVVPKRRSLFLGVEAWGKWILQVGDLVPQGRRKKHNLRGNQ